MPVPIRFTPIYKNVSILINATGITCDEDEFIFHEQFDLDVRAKARVMDDRNIDQSFSDHLA